MSGSADRVGIVMLLYNRADVAVPCVRSLAKARVGVPWELYLLDNGSRLEESAAVQREFERLEREGRLQGRFVRSEVNHGFPAGNNLGIRHFLERADVDHLCLLNSDVVLTDHWLDRLLEKGADAIGPVTNACGNEQTIPVPYSIEPDEPDAEVFDTVNEYAQERHERFQGYCKGTDFLGFFCFLARVELFCTVGLLDERFGRGAYEDDDFCMRILARGYRMTVARDVFVHHWGSASFSQMPKRAFSRYVMANRRKLEAKYGIEWRDRSLTPLAGLWDDVEHLARGVGEAELEMARLYARTNEGYTRYLLHVEGQDRPLLDLRLKSLRGRAVRWWKRRRVSKLFELAWALMRRRPVLVLGRRYPDEAYLNDGYFRRVKLIDELLEDHCRVYVRTEDVPPGAILFPGICRKKRLAYEVGIEQERWLHRVAVVALGLICRRVYVHSVLRFDDPFAQRLYGLSRMRVFDVHGSVPEEFEYEGHPEGAARHGELERQAIERASLVVVVSQSMAEHLAAKYGAGVEERALCLPMLPHAGHWDAGEQKDPRRGIVYSGGLHPWQQLDEMLEYVHRRAADQPVTFLVTDPEVVKRTYRERFGEDFPGTVTSAPAAQVARWYGERAYGLVLREKVVLNAVACPTKLVEYLQHGLVPIVDSPDIGDFPRLGYRYVQLDEPLPDEDRRLEMVAANRKVLRVLYYRAFVAAEALKARLNGRTALAAEGSQRPSPPAGG